MGGYNESLKDKLKINYSIQNEDIFIRAYNEKESHSITIPFTYFIECFTEIKTFGNISEIDDYLKNTLYYKNYDLYFERYKVALSLHVTGFLQSKKTVKFYLTKEYKDLSLEKIYGYISLLENRVINLENELINCKKELENKVSK